MPYEPALTAIAAATNDALTEHLWRYDTAEPGPLGKLAVVLAAAATRFNATATELARALDKNVAGCRHLSESIGKHGVAYPLTTDAPPSLPPLIERFAEQRDHLLSLYQAWRHYRSLNRDPSVRHLLTVPHAPRHGIVTLTCHDATGRWHLSADSVATDAYVIGARPGTLLGDINNSADGWQARSYLNPEHLSTRPDLVHSLPVTDSEAAACRALLRWTALRHTTDRTPDPSGLTTEQHADLIA